MLLGHCAAIAKCSTTIGSHRQQAKQATAHLAILPQKIARRVIIICSWDNALTPGYRLPVPRLTTHCQKPFDQKPLKKALKKLRLRWVVRIPESVCLLNRSNPQKGSADMFF